MADQTEPTLPNGHDPNPPESRILTLDKARRPLGKAGDYITRQQAADMVRDALASEIPKIHAFYLEQIPNFVARMIQDALLHYGLIKPVEPVDIQPAPEGEAVAVGGTAAVGPTSVDAASSSSDPEAAHPSDVDTRGSA